MLIVEARARRALLAQLLGRLGLPPMSPIGGEVVADPSSGCHRGQVRVTVRHKSRAKLSFPDALADAAPEHFSDLPPYLTEGVGGLRQYIRELTRWLEDNGSSGAALSAILASLG